MASRFAKGEGELSRLVREQQNLSAQWQQLDKAVVANRALPRRNATPPLKRRSAGASPTLTGSF